MNPETFAAELDNLLTRAMSQKPQPLSRILYELDLAHGRMMNVVLAAERRDAMLEMANQIVPANKLPGKN